MYPFINMKTKNMPQLALSLSKITCLLIAVGAICISYGQQHKLTTSQVYMFEFKPKVKEYKHSGDYTEQVLILSDKIALIKYLVKEKPNLLNFTIAQVEWGGDPESESISGYGITKLLVPGIERISMLSSNKLLVDVGTPSTEPRYALIDFDKKKALHGNEVKELPLGEASGEPVWIPASVYFDKQLVTFFNSNK